MGRRWREGGGEGGEEGEERSRSPQPPSHLQSSRNPILHCPNQTSASSPITIMPHSPQTHFIASGGRQEELGEDTCLGSRTSLSQPVGVSLKSSDDLLRVQRSVFDFPSLPSSVRATVDGIEGGPASRPLLPLILDSGDKRGASETDPGMAHSSPTPGGKGGDE